MLSDQFDHLNVIGFKVSVVLFWEKTGLFGNFFRERGGGPIFPNVYVRILTKSENFCENHKCFLGPKMQNKPLFLDGGLLNRGAGWGGVPTLGKKLPNNPVFFYEVAP